MISQGKKDHNDDTGATRFEKSVPQHTLRLHFADYNPRENVTPPPHRLYSAICTPSGRHATYDASPAFYIGVSNGCVTMLNAFCV
jgi:hypothetical protein